MLSITGSAASAAADPAIEIKGKLPEVKDEYFSDICISLFYWIIVRMGTGARIQALVFKG